MPVTVEASTASPAVSITQTGNRYHPPATETMTYDEDGNLTGDGRWVYTWDAENRLIGMTTQTSAVTAGVPNLKLTFAYDAQHRRIRKKAEIYDVPTTSWVTLTDTRFIYDGWNLLVEVEMHAGVKDAPAGASGPFVRRSYVWGTDISGTWQGAGGVSGLLAVRRHERGTKPMASYWTAWDLTGNILGLHNGSSSIAAMYEYDAFGHLLRESESEEELNPFRFSTKYTDAETGFAYYGYRFYDSVRGRWINRDPIEETGGLNLFGMVSNNPICYIDPNGTSAYEKCTVTLYVDHGGDAQTRLQDWRTGWTADSQYSPGSPITERFARASAIGCAIDGSNNTPEPPLGIEGFHSGRSKGGKEAEYNDMVKAEGAGGQTNVAVVDMTHATYGVIPAWNGGLNPKSIVKSVTADKLLDRFDYDAINQRRGYLKLIQVNWTAALNHGSKLASMCAKNPKICCCDKITVRMFIGETSQQIHNKIVGDAVPDDWKYAPRDQLTFPNLSKREKAYMFPTYPTINTFDIK